MKQIFSCYHFTIIIDIIPESLASYNDDDQGKFKTVVQFDCRGMEPCDFSPRVGLSTIYTFDKAKKKYIEYFSFRMDG